MRESGGELRSGLFHTLRQSTIQGCQHGTRHPFYNAQVCAGGRIRLTLPLLPVAEGVDGKAELCRKHGLSQSHIISYSLYVNMFRWAADSVRFVGRFVRCPIHICDSLPQTFYDTFSAHDFLPYPCNTLTIFAISLHSVLVRWIFSLCAAYKRYSPLGYKVKLKVLFS